MLSRREYGAKELKARLIAKGYAESSVESVISKLQEIGLQDDARYMEAFVASRLKRGYGLRRIEMELIANGISKPNVTSHLKKMQGNDSNLQDYYLRKFGAQAPQGAKALARRIRQLQWRGFSIIEIKRFLISLEGSVGDQLPDFAD